MSKTKSDKVPHYELLYLISNKFSETELGPIKTKVEKLIIDNGGDITVNQDWGKKRLAYPIHGFRHGYYHLLEFNLPGDKINYVDNQIRLASEIIRHQVVRTEPKTAEQLKAAEELRAKVMKKLELNEEKLAEKKAEVSAEKKAVEVTSSETEVEKPKLEMADLEDKLNRILENDNLL
jgi:small subunit ribosomal protein S6